MKRKIFTAAVVVILIITLGAVLVACDNGEELPTDTPVLWNKYLRDATDKIAQSVVMNGGRTGVKLEATAESGGEEYEMLFGLNFDLTAADGTGTCLVLEIGRAAADEDEERMFLLVSDNASTWINIASGLALSDARLQIENVSVFDLLNVALEKGAEAVVTAFSEMLYNFGMAFFDGVNVSLDQNTYAFYVNENFKESGRKYFEAFIGAFGENVGNALLAAFGIEGADELFDLIPDISGEIVLSFDEEGGAELSSEGLVIAEGEANLSADFEVKNELFVEFEDKIPQGEDAAGYVLTKIGNSHMEGTVDLMSNGQQLMSYDYVLDSNLDIFRLVLNDYDLNVLGEDNYIHLKVSHTCDSSCGEYCTSKLDSSRGSVLEIAFSPGDFDGAYNIYISIALRRLFTREKAEEYAALAGVSAEEFFPEYTLFTYPCEEFDATSPLYTLLMSFYADNMFTKDKIEIDLGAFDNFAGPFLTLLRGSGSTLPDKLVFNVDENDFGRAQYHDIYTDVVYIIDNNVGDTKNYTTFSWTDSFMQTIALYWEWEGLNEVTAGTLSGEKFTNLYDSEGALLHGVSNGAYVPISPEEIEGMAGEYYVKAECTYYDKTSVFDFYGRVLSIDGLDLESKEVQNVTLTVEYPNPFLSAPLKLICGDETESFTVTLAARIKLTSRIAGSVVFTPNVEEGTEMPILYGQKSSLTGLYSAQVTEVPKYLYANARVEYEDGYVKEMELVGESDAIRTREMLIFQDYYYSATSGEISVTWKFLEGVYSCNYLITTPDRVEFEIDADSMPTHSVGSTVYLSTITNYITAVAYYDNGTEEIGIRLYLTAEDLYINGIPLSKSSSYWQSSPLLLGGYTVEFYVANTYICNVRKFGFESDYFEVNVDVARGDAATFAFEQSSAEYPFWFTGIKYTFAGYITNATHGRNDSTSRQLTVSVEQYGKGSLSPSAVDIFASDSPVTLATFTASRYFVTGDTPNVLVTDEFPSLIIGSVYVAFYLTFNEPGYYRLRLYMNGSGGFTQYWYIAVAE